MGDNEVPGMSLMAVKVILLTVSCFITSLGVFVLVRRRMMTKNDVLVFSPSDDELEAGFKSIVARAPSRTLLDGLADTAERKSTLRDGRMNADAQRLSSHTFVDGFEEDHKVCDGANRKNAKDDFNRTLSTSAPLKTLHLIPR